MKAIVLGMYLPIIVLALPAAFLWVTRLIIPAVREHGLDVGRYAIGIGIALSLVAHVLVHSFGLGVRAFGLLGLAGSYGLLAVIAGTTLAACCFAAGGLSHSITGRARPGLIAIVVVTLWGCGVWVFW